MDPRVVSRSLAVTAITMLLVCMAALVGCGEDKSESIVFQFRMYADVSGLEDFRVVTNDPDTIAIAREQLRLPREERLLHIGGPIAHGNGGFNLNWNWHFKPNLWTFREVSIELCDTGPTLISQNVDYWVNLGACPWGFSVLAEIGPLH